MTIEGNKEAKKANWIFFAILTIGLVATVMLTGKPVSWFSRAGGTKIYLTSVQKALGVGQTQSVDILMDAQSDSLAFANIEINFEQSKINLAKQAQMDAKFKRQVLMTSEAEANRTGRIKIAAGIDPDDSIFAQNGLFRLASLQFKNISDKPNDAVEITIDPESLKLISVASTEYKPEIINLDLTLNP